MALPGAFWRFASASGISNVADGVLLVALPLAALQLTRSPVLIAGIAVAARLPWLLFALLAGVVVDRVDRRRLMVVCAAGRCAPVAVVALLLATGTLALWHLFVAALVLGTIETLFDSAAQSALPMVVPAQGLAAANSRLFGIEVTGQTFIGSPLGGLLAGVALWVAAGTGALAYAVAAVLLLTVGGRFRADRPTAEATAGSSSSNTVRQDIAEGLRYLQGSPVLRRLALLTGGCLLTSSIATSVLVLFAVAPGPMGLSEAGYGLLLTASGVGAVAASLTAERVIAALGPARTLRLAVLAFAAAVASPLLLQPIAVGAVQALGGAAVTAFNVVAVSYRQQAIPAHLLGRVNSVYRLIAWGGIPIGSAIGGGLAYLVGLHATFAIAGAAALLMVIGTRGLTDDTLREGEVTEVRGVS